MSPVFVIGHRNPDTDSICSAICYANLKRILTGEEYIACRAGHVNTETKFVLEHFGVEPPRYIATFEPRLSDVQYREVAGIDSEMSLRRAWDYMNENDIQTLAVVDEDRHLKGLLTLSDIARFYMEDQDANALAEAKTSYRNLVDVLDGTLVAGELEQPFEEGRVVVAAANPDVLEDYIAPNDMVILGNRYESQLCAIEMNAGCIIIGLGAKVSRTIRKLASENGVSIIATPLDIYLRQGHQPGGSGAPCHAQQGPYHLRAGGKRRGRKAHGFEKAYPLLSAARRAGKIHRYVLSAQPARP